VNLISYCLLTPILDHPDNVAAFLQEDSIPLAALFFVWY
jgi:hypothetical protein